MIALALRGALQEKENIMETKNKVVSDPVQFALQYLQNVGVFEIARVAECGSPDSHDSAGAELLDTIRICLIDHLRYDPKVAVPVSEIANSSVTVYTHPIWLQFVDLCGYNEDLSDYMALGSTMTEQASYVLAHIAERAIVSLCEMLELKTDQD